MTFHTVSGSPGGLAAEFARRQLGSDESNSQSRSKVDQSIAVHIVGAGPSGLAAALAVVQAGAKAVLIDDNDLPGGQIWRGGVEQWRDSRVVEMWRELHAHPNFQHIKNAQVVGALGKKCLFLEAGKHSLKIEFDRLILCAGAREIFLPFPGWTLPGVTGAGGMQALIKGGMSVSGKELVIAGSGPLLLATAATALNAGANIVAIVEHRKTKDLFKFGLSLALQHRAKFVQAISLFSKLSGIPYIKDGSIIEARGSNKVESVLIRSGGRSTAYSCDFLAAGFGLTPNTELASALGCRLQDHIVYVDNNLRTSNEHVWAAGECTGIGGVDKAIVEGRIAAFNSLGITPSDKLLVEHRKCIEFADLIQKSFELDDSLKSMCWPETIVCRCEDVPAAELSKFNDWRTAKLSTRVGMGPCQGRTCAVTCKFLFGWEPEQSKFPISPARAGSLSQVDEDKR